ncbi:hypothetical protein DFH09DRAFT_1074534 [Mycena vulgaris]|nr:hypothetical protein DFH09DRAFT_1074534 [Mycena vulgaris]
MTSTRSSFLLCWPLGASLAYIASHILFSTWAGCSSRFFSFISATLFLQDYPRSDFVIGLGQKKAHPFLLLAAQSTSNFEGAELHPCNWTSDVFSYNYENPATWISALPKIPMLHMFLNVLEELFTFTSMDAPTHWRSHSVERDE